MKLKDKFLLASVAFALLSVFGVCVFVFAPVDSLKTIISIITALLIVGLMACLKAIGELGLWEHEETRPLAEARLKHRRRVYEWWF